MCEGAWLGGHGLMGFAQWVTCGGIDILQARRLVNGIENKSGFAP